MRGRHRAEERADELRVGAAAHGDAALAVAGRLGRVQARQRARRLRDAAELARDDRQRGRRVELAGDHQHRVVRLVVGAVERAQALDVDALDVRARADDRLAVGVPVVGRRLHLLPQHEQRVVLAALELVAHDRHLGVERLLADEGLRHALGLDLDRELEVLRRRGEGLVVVRAVEARRAVHLHAAAAELLPQVLDRRRAEEQHVLEQVRHAGLAVVLVARADAVGDRDRRGRLARVGEEDDLEPVVERVLGHALDRGTGGDAGRELRERQRGREEKDGGEAGDERTDHGARVKREGAAV